MINSPSVTITFFLLNSTNFLMSMFSCFPISVLPKIKSLLLIKAVHVVIRWIGVSSSSLHLVHVDVSESPIRCRCLLSLQWPVIVPIIDRSSLRDLRSRIFVVCVLGPCRILLLCLQFCQFFHIWQCLFLLK